MPEIQSQRVHTYTEKLFCECGKEMLSDRMLLSSPPWYVMVCSGCDKEYRSRTSYPRVSYAPVELMLTRSPAK